MKLPFYYGYALPLLTIACIITTSCSKDEIATEYPENTLIQQRSSVSIPDDPIIYNNVILGEETENPFSIDNLKDALRESCLDSLTLNVTDRLIRFTFTDKETFMNIHLDTSFILFPFPLNRKILEMGDMYDDGRDREELEDLYAIVDINTAIPSKYDYEVLDEYDYGIKNIYAIVESFRRTDNMNSLGQYLKTMDVNDLDTLAGCSLKDTIIFPAEDCPPECHYEITVTQTPNHVLISFECICPEVEVETTICGCIPYSMPRTLAGCIRVENNSTNVLDPVEDVEVIVQDRFSPDPLSNWWFKSHKTRTDANGCWKMSHRFSDNVWVWVRFKNEDSFERCGLYSWPISEALRPVKDYAGVFAEPEYKSIGITYNHWGGVNTGTELHRNWGAATINNEVKEYIRVTPDISNPPSELDILLNPSRSDGAALMMDFGQVITQVIMPDLSIGIDRPNNNNLEALTFHELGHASHFAQVGSSWWGPLFQQELQNSAVFSGHATGLDAFTFTFIGDPHGNGTEPSASYVALAESSSDYISATIRNINQENVLFENGYIPTGLYHDLVDVNTTGFDLAFGIRDNVSGFTRAQLFGALNPLVTTVPEYGQELSAILPNGNTSTALDTLIMDYTR